MRRRSLAPPRWDLLLAATLLAVGEIEVALIGVRPRSAAICAAGLGAGALAWRRVSPLAALAFAFTVECVQYWVGVPRNEATMPLVVFIVASYTLGSRATMRDVALGGVLALGLVWSVVLTSSPFDASDLPWTALIVIAPLALGRALRSTREQASASVAYAERKRELATLEALAAERERIARELHDIVSHSISVMGVQAGAVRRLLPEGEDELRELLTSIEGTGREALGEMRRLLGIVRDGEQARGSQPRLAPAREPAPQPGLARLDELVAQSKSAGLAIELSVIGTPTPLPPGLDLTAYRIIQEALTNVRKHAPRALAAVTLCWSEQELELTVIDNGPGPADSSPTGHGIVGMRERASLYGGELETGPAAAGGFRVWARLPLPGEAQ